MAMRREDYPIFNGRVVRDSRVIVDIKLDNSTDVKFEKVIKVGENAIEYVISELIGRGYQNGFISGYVSISDLNRKEPDYLLDILYRDKWILTGEREVSLIQHIVYYPFESRGIAYEDVLKPKK